jgi:hypothetical protein
VADIIHCRQQLTLVVIVPHEPAGVQCHDCVMQQPRSLSFPDPAPYLLRFAYPNFTTLMFGLATLL